MPVDRPVSVFMWTMLAFFFPAGLWWIRERNFPVYMLYVLTFMTGFGLLIFFGLGLLILIPLAPICALHTFVATRRYNREVAGDLARQDHLYAAVERLDAAE